jgi:multiple sugar transport system substrate-binding protein
MPTSRSLRLLVTVVAGALVLAACGGGGTDVSAADDPDLDPDVTLSYWLWDSNQQPAYEQCAEDFTAESGIDVEFTLYGWDDYWSNLTTQFTAGRAPDVFTDHLAFYPEFVASEVLIPLDEFIERDGTDLDQYFPGLVDLWQGQDGSQYGLPKDWDTIAMFYDEQMLDDAGLTSDELWDAEWNPDDGGSFEEVLARLSVDANGNRGDAPEFDADDVDVYALGYFNPAEASGQASWSGFARSAGFEYLADSNPWGTEYQFDDPALAATLDWWSDMIDAGYAAPLDAVQGLGQATLFEAGSIALSVDGSWAIGNYTGLDREVGFAPLPTGPEGRFSMFNGLADSITVDTEYPEEAWAWVSYLGSFDCQQVIGERAIVFPAIEEATEIRQQVDADAGLDVSAWVSYLDDDDTFLFPVTDNFDQVNSAMAPAVEEILLGRVDATSRLEAVQTQVDQIMGRN